MKSETEYRNIYWVMAINKYIITGFVYCYFKRLHVSVDNNK